ncbi:BtrH N-terminal domain-containing protein [Anaerosporobacter faecicola]|uniref:BtrH N-terminal domain-containing protein n=1 Tax=Anaerosporobacter faecicola TaxID=2718714 RepID=UPI00143C0BBD|nr:BtrH N-terminal domain-containing protein [Anaerosporobacter faecicola]
MRKIIALKHHLCSGCCMWSGIEDVYEQITGEQVPEGFFFGMSCFGENTYIKLPDENQARMFSVGDGRTRKVYDKLKDLIGLSYRISEGGTVSYALKTIKKEINEERPVILGPLDMYHLPYVKMYHKDHIPMHYVLMVGYDEEKNCVYIYDCDRIDLLELPIDELIKAWNIEKNAVGDKNGFIRFTLSENPMSVEQIMDISMKRKAEEQLREKPIILGMTAFDKIASEFPNWEKELGKDLYRKTLMGLTEFFGKVPKLPNRLLGVGAEEKDIPYQAHCDCLGNVLLEMGNRYQRKDWTQASTYFLESGVLFERITDCVVRYLCDNEDTLSEVPELFLQIKEKEEAAYRLLL